MLIETQFIVLLHFTLKPWAITNKGLSACNNQLCYAFFNADMPFASMAEQRKLNLWSLQKRTAMISGIDDSTFCPLICRPLLQRHSMSSGSAPSMAVGGCCPAPAAAKAAGSSTALPALEYQSQSSRTGNQHGGSCFLLFPMTCAQKAVERSCILLDKGGKKQYTVS